MAAFDFKDRTACGMITEHIDLLLFELLKR